jgi:hypothetical protein
MKYEKNYVKNYLLARRKLSSPFQKLGSWIQIPLEAWVYVWFYCFLFLVVLCREGPCNELFPIQVVLQNVCKNIYFRLILK